MSPKRIAAAADVLDALPDLIREARGLRGVSLRDAADEADVGFNTLFRVERGGNASLSNVKAILRWLATPGVSV